MNYKISKTVFYNSILIGIFLVYAGFNWEQFIYYNNPVKRISIQHKNIPVLFSAEWCTYCRLMRDRFTKEKIQFVEYDVEKSEKGMRLYQELEGKGVPLLLVNQEVVPGFNPEKFESVLTKLNDEFIKR